MNKTKKIFLYIFLPLFIFLFWIYITIPQYLKRTGDSLSSSIERITAPNYPIEYKEGLLQGNKISGSFRSSINRLGTLMIRFNTFNRINKDSIIFKLKEENSPDWNYTAEIKTDQFQPNELFPFGFPIIEDSKGKIYIYEIESARGIIGDRIAVSDTYPVIVSKYIVSKEYLFSNPLNLIKFAFNKVIFMFQDGDLFSQWKIFVGIMILYFMEISFYSNYWVRYFVISIATIADIVSINNFHWYIVPILMIFWVLMISNFNKTFITTFYTAVFYILFSVIFLVRGDIYIVDRSLSWGYYLLIFSLLQNIKGNSVIVKIGILINKARKLINKEHRNKFSEQIYEKTNIRPYVLLGVLIVILIKLPYIFHGNWNDEMFFPYMTDETVLLSSVTSYFVTDKFILNPLLIFGYPPFTFNILFGYFYLFINFFTFIHGKFSEMGIYQTTYFQTRALVLIFSAIGSLYYFKLFSGIIKNKVYLGLMILLINFNALFFLYSTYAKTDLLVWATGNIALYAGLKHWKDGDKKTFFVFGLLSLIPAMINYYGYVYLLFFYLISFLMAFSKKHNYYTIDKIAFSFLLIPATWLIGNFQLISHIKDVFIYFINYATSNYKSMIPFLENINNYPSYKYYLDYVKYLLIPIPVAIICVIYALYKVNIFYKAIIISLLIFIIQISMSTYRSDRVFIPILTLIIALTTFMFDNLSGFFNKKLHQYIILMIFILMFTPSLVKGGYLMKTLPGMDTRQILYYKIINTIPNNSKIYFIHNSIFGAHATAQYLRTKNIQNYEINIVDMSIEDERNSIKNEEGYFIISEIDRDMIIKFKDTSYYGDAYKIISGLIEKGKLIISVDKINYKLQPFGPASFIPNSLYGIQNPPLLVYKITGN